MDEYTETIEVTQRDGTKWSIRIPVYEEVLRMMCGEDAYLQTLPKKEWDLLAAAFLKEVEKMPWSTSLDIVTHLRKENSHEPQADSADVE